MPRAFEPINANEPVDQVGARVLSVAALAITWLRCLSEFAQEHPGATEQEEDAAMLRMSRNLAELVVEVHPRASVAYSDLEELRKHFNLNVTQPLLTEVLQ